MWIVRTEHSTTAEIETFSGRLKARMKWSGFVLVRIYNYLQTSTLQSQDKESPLGTEYRAVANNAISESPSDAGEHVPLLSARAD